ncbi:MAG TPA: NUDIX domain-containing protein [Anaerolineae bacterium]|nr:NUDIX domain-containing protein [Anaerolineae bacterium]
MNQSFQTVYAAAGGVVMDGKGERVLLLVRPARDEVRLPKGHIDANETAEEAARREVIEESGYDDLEIVADLGEQLVVFWLDNRQVRREERYFLMQALSQRQVTRPPEDEHQFFPTWATWEEARSSLTFAAEQEWLRRAQQAQTDAR